MRIDSFLVVSLAAAVVNGIAVPIAQDLARRDDGEKRWMMSDIASLPDKREAVAELEEREEADDVLFAKRDEEDTAWLEKRAEVADVDLEKRDEADDVLLAKRGLVYEDVASNEKRDEADAIFLERRIPADEVLTPKDKREETRRERKRSKSKNSCGLSDGCF